MIQTKFLLKPEQETEFEEGKVCFKIKNINDDFKRVKIEISTLKRRDEKG